MLLAAITGGALAGWIILGLVLLGCLIAAAAGLIHAQTGTDSGGPYRMSDKAVGLWWVAGAVIVALLTAGLWWWSMAFTTSGDYHAWNVKEGIVEKVAKRLVAAGDSGMQERYVVTIDGQPYGIDDTRAALVEPGDQVSLRCKKDYQWGVPRDAHGWACRWNKVPGA
jgi:hypothetical protein